MIRLGTHGGDAPSLAFFKYMMSIVEQRPIL